jgi:hypothetical protein
MSETTAAAVDTTEAPQPGHNGLKNTPANRGASRSKTAHTPKQDAHKAKRKREAKSAPQKPAAKNRPNPKKAAKPAVEPREGSKKAIILDLLRRPKGATLDELMKSTKWQAHSVRGFISGPLKRAGMTIDSTKTEAGERTYRITK